MSYEITINVYAPDFIGSLIDNLLKLPDITIKGFEWKPLEVLLPSFRKKIQRKRPSRKASSKEKAFATKLDSLLAASSTLRKWCRNRKNKRATRRKKSRRNPKSQLTNSRLNALRARRQNDDCSRPYYLYTLIVLSLDFI